MDHKLHYILSRKDAVAERTGRDLGAPVLREMPVQVLLALVAGRAAGDVAGEPLHLVLSVQSSSFARQRGKLCYPFDR